MTTFHVNNSIYFTALDGSEATITGNEGAISAIEDAFIKAGIKYNEQVGCWDAGFYGPARQIQRDRGGYI